MAHFAQLDENNTVITVTVVSNDDLIDENGNESEALGIAVCEAVVGHGPWIQTSYNGNFRKQFAGVGFTYDADADVFVSPAPYDSWILNDQYDWEPPTPRPEGDYRWNEDTQTWDQIPNEEPAP